LVSFLLVVAAAEAGAQAPPTDTRVAYRPPSPVGPLSLQAVSDLEKPATGKPFVVPLFPEDARVEQASDWPATFFGRYLVAGATYFCTATLVGSRTLITAAHCVGSDPTLIIRKGGDQWTATCERSSDYSPDWSPGCSANGSCPTSADYALCEIKGNAPNFPRHERLNNTPGPIAIGGVVKFVGFGCTQTNQTGGSSLDKDVLSSGWGRITRVPGPSDNYFNTEATLQGAALPLSTTVKEGSNVCPGDSGGAVYLSGKNLPQVRSIVGVVSRVYTQNGNITGPSLLSALYTPAAKKLFDGWKAAKNTDLCGLGSTNAACTAQ
jgi:hypothetical protein